ncbi:hypothetical protein ACF1BE_17775 [Streptomyces sp. NPDC014991]|uniref:hypothetical protein n=1 Tax=Streptomyces sp. NPDC014991 TaxID=3364935 RepID=UPI0036FC311D
MRASRPLGIPVGLTDWLLAAAQPADALEHVSVHALPGGGLTLGFFHAVGRLRDAERSALRLALHMVQAGPLRGYRVHSCGGVLVARYHDAFLDGGGDHAHPYREDRSRYESAVDRPASEETHSVTRWTEPDGDASVQP